MKGFTDKAILVLPREATYTTRPIEWQRLFRKSLVKLVDYLEMLDIKVFSFNSDELSDVLKLNKVQMLDIVTPEDKMLLEGFLLGGEKVPKGVTFENKDSIFKEGRKKFPVKRGSSLEEKTELFLKRDKFIANKIIDGSKLVINCELATKAYYNTKPKVGDNKIIININMLNFAPEVYFNGELTDAVSLLIYKRAYSPLHTWEV